MKTGYTLGAAAGLLGAVLVPLAAAGAAHAGPNLPEPPCIVTGTGQCVPDTVWPIHAGGGPVHSSPPAGHPGLPPVSGPPEVISCIVGEGCFTRPAPDPTGGAPIEHDPGAGAEVPLSVAV